MKITNLHIKNIGVFDDALFEFGTSKGTDIHIFTGPNGCGKTTLLLVLAGLFMGDTKHETNKESANFLKKRVRFFEKNEDGTYKSFAKAVFENHLDGMTLTGCDNCKNFHALANFHALEERNEELRWYNDMLRQYNNTKAVSEKFKFAVFAYSGYRYIESRPIKTLENGSPTNPLADSLNFIKNYTDNSTSILQWIANNAAKYFISKGRGDVNAEKFREAIRCVELILKEITGKAIEFEISLEPVEVLLKIEGKTFDFDVLPDGLRSLISWIADLLMRLDMLPWEDNMPILERSIILLLDEVEAHLHPKWQRKVLPVVQKLFKNAQVFVSTHSPFVVNSVDGAYIHKIAMKNGVAQVSEATLSNTADSIDTVLNYIFDVEEDFGWKTQNQLDNFYKYRNDILKGNEVDEDTFLELAISLAKESVEVRDIVQFEVRQINKKRNKNYVI